MKDNPLVSIIITNFNYGQFLREAIDSALSQNYSPFEVIVVDDGSTDISREIIASYKGKIIPVLKENAGQASSFNAGFAVSQGDIICFLDSDDSFLPEKLSEIVNIFTNKEDISWCFHTLSLIDINTNKFSKSSNSFLSQQWDFRAEIKKKGKLPFIPSATSGLCFTRRLLELILPMPESFSITLSDNYLKFTALALSKGFFLNKDLSLQKIHGGNAYTMRRNREYMKARISIFTAYWMRINFPSLSKFTDNLLVFGVGTYWCIGGLEKEEKEIFEKYLLLTNFRERLKINLKAFYFLLKQNCVLNDKK